MFPSEGGFKQTCTLLAVTCGRSSENGFEKNAQKDQSKYPFPELISSGRLEVRTLNNPEKEQVCKMLESFQPNIVYFQGKRLENGDVGPLELQGSDFSNCEAVLELFGTTLPTAVYLEIPNGESLAQALHYKGVPYVVYWKNIFSYHTVSHFWHAFLSVVQSSPTHTWDAFQLARSSFKIYCVQKNGDDTGNNVLVRDEMEPHLLGDHLKINVGPPEVDEGEEQEGSTGALSAVKIHDEDVSLRFLVCGPPKNVDASLLRSLEDGLGALLTIEIRASKLQGKYSAAPPPLQAATFSRGVVTMRCDLLTSSSAHVSLLVSGSAQTCFDDQLFENHIKNEIIERNQLVHVVLDNEEYKPPVSEPRKSISIACGASVFEVRLKLPQWAFQILRQLAPDVAYRSLVALGIASIQGLPVASFEKDDAERLLFFCERNGEFLSVNDLTVGTAPSWFQPPPPTKKRCERSEDTTIGNHDNADAAPPLAEGKGKKNRTPLVPVRQRLKVSAMRPIPHIHRLNMKPFSGISDSVGYYSKQVKINIPIAAPIKHNILGSASATQQKSYSGSLSKHAIPLNPLPLKKHGCGRAPIQACSEEEFLRDVVQFLVLRGHTRLIPQGGLAEFPEAILNGTRLDLYNLYNEVVTRGGFHVGNGINWKGQIFSKMRNYTMTNRMTGVGNTLKRHYETYLLEYELAHDDVGGECCLLCHSSAPGDWVNCGICGEWAHFGCDRRQGLGAFKDYAKTDGLEYTCPHCIATNFKKKANTTANG